MYSAQIRSSRTFLQKQIPSSNEKRDVHAGGICIGPDSRNVACANN